MTRHALPLLSFVALCAFLLFGLYLKPGATPSPLLGQALPTFQLPNLETSAQAAPTMRSHDLQGKLRLINVWASWCGACRQEHPLLLELAKNLPILGLNYKDQRREALFWLRQHGNPYQISGFDQDGRVGMELGVVGVPESFLIDRHGVIRFRHNGALTADIIQTQLLPLIRELNGV